MLVDVGDRLGGPAADLHDVNGDVLLGDALRDRHRVALEILAVRHQHHDATMALGHRVAPQEIHPELEGARDGRAADGHVGRRELSEELRDGAAVVGQREAQRLSGERHRTEACPREVRDEPGHLALGALRA